MTFPSANILERCAVRPASSRRASADAICARSTPASSSTSTWPSRAICPDSNRILLTVPGTSLLTETLRRLEMLPTAATVVSQFSCLGSRRSHRLGGRAARHHLLAHRHERADLRSLDSDQNADDDQQAGRHQQVSFQSSLSRHGAKSKAA